jgi:hypothetical protein
VTITSTKIASKIKIFKTQLHRKYYFSPEGKKKKKKKRHRQYEAKGNLKSSNGVGGDGGVCAAHVGRGIHVVKRSC